MLTCKDGFGRAFGGEVKGYVCIRIYSAPNESQHEPHWR